MKAFLLRDAENLMSSISITGHRLCGDRAGLELQLRVEVEEPQKSLHTFSQAKRRWLKWQPHY